MTGWTLTKSGANILAVPTHSPNVLTRQRSKLYIQPIGSFSQRQQELIQFITEYLSIYFNCPVMLLETKDESGIPESAQRDDPTLGTHQLLTSHLLERVLAPNLPADAFALIAFTSSDLWPGDGWNFVFGYATYRDRVGVWSLNRLGDPDSSQSAFTRCLTRTIRIATHEGGHMFFSGIASPTHATCRAATLWRNRTDSPSHFALNAMRKSCSRPVQIRSIGMLD